MHSDSGHMTGPAATDSSEAPVQESLAQRARRLEHELFLRETEIALLKETSDAVVGELRLDKVLQLVADRTRTLIKAETVLIPTLDQDCSQYTYSAGSGRNIEEIVGESLPLDFGICGWVWKHRKAWWRGVLDELEPEERTQWEKEAGTVILVPLFGKQHFLGGIAGLNKSGGGDFDRRDLDLLTLFANQVSIAIENAINFATIEQARIEAEDYRIKLESVNSRLAQANQDLEYLALYDNLTSLPNRSLIQDRLKQSLLAARRDHQSLAVLMTDLDHFKEVNDTLGHEAGDRLLKEVSRRLEGSLRRTDTVGRLGGDEFAIIIPNADVETATLVATSLLKSLEPPFQLDANTVSVAASIGITLFPAHGEDSSTLLQHADIAMYAAKRARQGYAVYDSGVHRHNPSHLARLGELRDAINNNDMQLYYQPKVDLKSGRITGVEALARWPHRDRGMIMPDEFIPVLEHTGLIKPFTLWALDTALRQCSEWWQMGIELSVAVNISAHNLRDPQLATELTMLIKKWNLTRGALYLEITESAVMGDSSLAVDILSNLASKGIRIAIDDYGTGYSSLSHLKKLPLHELKVDKSFVMDMEQDSDSAVIVRSTIDLAHNLGLKVVAEGAETPGNLDMLRELGCDMVQGYYIARPMPAEALVQFIGNSAWKPPLGLQGSDDKAAD